jgi:hypothetical protein
MRRSQKERYWQVSYEEKFQPRITELLKRLKKATDVNTKEFPESEQRKEAGPTLPSAVRKTSIDPEPSFWPIGGGLARPGKSSSQLYSWRSDREVQDAIAKVALYLHVQRDIYYPMGQPLSAELKNHFSGFYSPGLLNRVRIAELQDRRVANPWFYDDAKSQGIANLPEMAHRAVVTFLDVVVFNEKMTHRHLFHGLVHTAQVKLLGPVRYAELFVTGFLQARSFFLVPMKAHAFALDTRYIEDPGARFSVEEEVLRWITQDRY